MINNYADTIRAMQFEGVYFTDTFTDQTWLETEEIQKIYLTLMFSNETRSLMVSRMLRKPIEIMKAKVDAMLGIKNLPPQWSDLKYIIYSAHDTQVDNMEVWLNPNDYQMNFIKFASSIFYELKYSESCLQSSPSTECFWVDILYNNIPLTFEGFCNHSVRGCSFSDFLQMMEAKWYSGLDDDNLNKACSQQYNF